MDMTQVTRAHVNIREARRKLKSEYEAEDKQLAESLTKIEGVMLGYLSTNNMESVRTEAGTFYRQEDVKPSGSDWNALYDWVKEHDAFDALERRIKKTFITEYMEANGGALPPGVSVHREFVVRVRKPS